MSSVWLIDLYLYDMLHSSLNECGAFIWDPNFSDQIGLFMQIQRLMTQLKLWFPMRLW